VHAVTCDLGAGMGVLVSQESAAGSYTSTTSKGAAEDDALPPITYILSSYTVVPGNHRAVGMLVILVQEPFRVWPIAKSEEKWNTNARISNLSEKDNNLFFIADCIIT
jgi:hypothetical protein